ncbi:MAG: hypothetical protein EOM72_13860 [Opitutae bacterium]|nr:hypothetical protein [Opitutae bacterium]
MSTRLLTADDYQLPARRDHVWITVNNLSVYIRRTDEGVVVDLFPVQREMDERLASTYAFFAEAEPDAEAEAEAEARAPARGCSRARAPARADRLGRGLGNAGPWPDGRQARGGRRSYSATGKCRAGVAVPTAPRLVQP